MISEKKIYECHEITVIQFVYIWKVTKQANLGDGTALTAESF